MTPNLTVGVPHLDRTDLLKGMLDCLVDQTVPCKILVADQGHTDATAELMASYADNPLVMHCRTDATRLHDNWGAAAKLAMADGCRYFAWAQDDDLVHARYSERINLAFDCFPDALTWTARLAVAQDPELAIHYSGCGPMIPMNLMKNKVRCILGHLMVPYGYFSSWSLSPAVAFRAGIDFREALEAIPRDCDLYTERTILAEMGSRGQVVCDPCVLGYWIHHTRNESYRQNSTTQPEQQRIFLDWLDDLMDRTEGWEEYLLDWAHSMPNTHLNAFIAGLQSVDSRYAPGVAEILRQGLKDEISYEEIRKRRATDPTHVMPMMI